MPAFSLILATVGRTQELNRLFDSLAAQTYPDFEIIIVDQNTDDRLLPHIAHAEQAGLTVRHLKHHPPNLAAARNTGLAAAQGEWVAFPDDDCWYDPALLQRVALRFTTRPAPEGVTVRWVEQGEPPFTAPVLSWKRSAAFRDVPVASITIFLQRRLLDVIGGFDARFGVGQWFGAAEEHDLVLRALRHGAVIAYEPQAEVHHAVAPAQPQITQEACTAARCRARGTGALYAKHRLPPWVILRGMAAPILRPLMKGKLGSELAHGLAVARGRLDGFFGWNRLQH